MVATIGSAKKVKSVKKKPTKKTKENQVKRQSTLSSDKTSVKTEKVIIHPKTRNKVEVDLNNNDCNNNTEFPKSPLKLPSRKVPKKNIVNLYEKLKDSFTKKKSRESVLTEDDYNILDDF